MANKFAIIISATDKATKTFDRVNARMAAINKPFKDLNKSFATFKKESGLEKVTQSFGKLKNAAGDVARTVASIVTPLAAVTGLASVAGIAELATAWGHVGQNIANTSSAIGVSSGDLQQYRAAAQLAGLSAGDMDSSLQSLGNTLHGAQWGANPAAQAMLNSLNITFKRTKSGAVDSVQALKDIADQIAKRKGNPQVQQRIADTFGIGALLPLLQKGSAGIDEYLAQAKKLGLIMSPEQIENAQKYAQNITAFDLTLENLKNTIGNSLVPVLQPMINGLTAWVSQNKELIATKIGTFVQELADWVSQIDFKAVADGLSNFVGVIGGGINAVGGLGNALMIVAGIKLAGIITDMALLARNILLVGEAVTGLSIVGAAGFFGGLGALVFAAYETIKLLRDSTTPGNFVSRQSGPAHPFGTNPGPAVNAALPAATGFHSRQDTNAHGANSGAYIAPTPLPMQSAPQITGAPAAAGVPPVPGASTAAAVPPLPGTPAVVGVPPVPGASTLVNGADPSQLFSALETQYTLPKGLLDSDWSAESARGKKMLSPKGAQGHFGFMPDTQKEYGLKDPNDLSESAAAAARKFNGLYRRYGGDDQKAIAAYNWGEGHLDLDIKKNGPNWLAHAPAETQGYVGKVMAGMAGNGGAVPSIYAQEQSAPEQSIYAQHQGVVPANQPQTAESSMPSPAEVVVRFENAPQGMKVSTKAKGNLSVQTRIGYAMDGAAV